MKVNQDDLNYVEAELQKQNAIYASIGAGLVTIPVLILWYVAYQYNPQFSPIMLAISGVLVGLTVRWLGRGYSRQFSAIAFISHLTVVLSAFLIGLSFEGRIRGFILLGLYAGGAWAAMYLAKKNISSIRYRAFYQLAISASHSSYQKLQNKWFVAVPLSLTICFAASYITLGFLLVSHSHSIYETNRQTAQSRQDLIESRHIDVTPKALDKLSTKQALIYAYAYYSGNLMSTNGRFVKKFPTSTYTSQTILKYLVKHRANERARFILGTITEGSKSHQLLSAAAKGGDEFAEFYSMVEYGCDYDDKQSVQLLKQSYRLMKEDAVKFEIARVLERGSEQLCQYGLAQFHYRYIKDYKAPKREQVTPKSS